MMNGRVLLMLVVFCTTATVYSRVYDDGVPGRIWNKTDTMLAERYRTGLEVPVFGGINFPVFSSSLEDDLGYCVDKGYSFSSAVGVFLRFNNGFMVKTGYQYWQKKWDLCYPYLQYEASNRIEETGRFMYHGLYVSAVRDFRPGYFGGGFEFSVLSSYESDVCFSESPETEAVSDFEGEKVNGQVDVYAEAGLNIRFSRHFTMKPGMRIGLPLRPLFNSDQFIFNIFVFRVGLTSELYL